MASFPLQIKVSRPVLIGLIKTEGTGSVCGFLSPYWNLLQCLRHMAKRKMSHQESSRKPLLTANVFFFKCNLLGRLYWENWLLYINNKYIVLQTYVWVNVYVWRSHFDSEAFLLTLSMWIFRQ